MVEIEITALRKVERFRANKSGDMIVALFDAKIGPVTLRDCALAEGFSDGRWIVWPPRGAKGKQGLAFIEAEARAELTGKAGELYRAFSGS